MKFMIIAIDGPAASGKSTAAEALAARLDFLYFDTGVMYRAVTLAGLKKFGSIDNEGDISSLSKHIHIDVQTPTQEDGRMFDVLLDGEDVTWEIRSPRVTANVSKVSAYPVVREEMTNQQRKIGDKGNVVMVGRDIGTVVMPDADYKFYIDASAEVRAQRRYDEVVARGEEASYDEMLEAIRKRDQFDSTRAVAPLVPAEDAIHILNDELTREEVVEKMLMVIQKTKERETECQ
jgi:cytidylate kinase